MNVRFLKLYAGSKLPEYKTTSSAGADVSACLEAPMTIAPGAIVLVPTGFSMELPHGYEAQIRPRSGLALKGISVPNAPGTIDADYRGEVKVILINLGKDPFTVNHGDRIAQMVIARHEQPELVWEEALSETARGQGGFGSTGVK